MQKINFQNLPSTTTPINATNLNALQDNVEDVFDGDVPMGDIVVDSIRSKNMFDVASCVSGTLDNNTGLITRQDGSTINQINIETGSIVFTTSSNYVGVVSDYIKVDANTTYYLSNNSDYASMYYLVCYYDNSKTRITHIYGDTIHNFTTPNNTKYIRIVLETSSNTPANTQITLSSIQLEKGTTATNFCPHQIINYEDTGWIDANLSSNVSNFYLRPKYRKIGKIVQVIGEVDCTDLSQNAEILTGLPQPVGLIRIPTTYSNGVAQTYLSNNGTLCCVYGISNTLFLNFMYIAN